MDGAIPPRLAPVAESVRATLAYLGEREGIQLFIDSDIPPASGLGSSSSVAVASVAAAAAALGHRLRREKLVEFAMISEKLVHEQPSGIDVNIAAHGGVILFSRGGKPAPVRLEEPVEFVVASSGRERETAAMIRRVSEAKERHPELFAGLVQASTQLSELAASCLRRGQLENLGPILSVHHALLSWLGASIEALDEMVDRALKAGALGAKLTGAGGGGCVLALPKPAESAKIMEALRAFGKEAFITSLPVEGVKVWREAS